MHLLCYLDQLGVVVRELAVGQFVSLDDPGVFEDLPGGQSLMGIHVEHLGHEALQEARDKYDSDAAAEDLG